MVQFICVAFHLRVLDFELPLSLFFNIKKKTTGWLKQINQVTCAIHCGEYRLSVSTPSPLLILNDSVYSCRLSFASTRYWNKNNITPNGQNEISEIQQRLQNMGTLEKEFESLRSELDSTVSEEEASSGNQTHRGRGFWRWNGWTQVGVLKRIHFQRVGILLNFMSFTKFWRNMIYMNSGWY